MVVISVEDNVYGCITNGFYAIYGQSTFAVSLLSVSAQGDP